MSGTEVYAVCKCGNDTFVQKFVITTRGTVVDRRVVDACEKCGRVWKLEVARSGEHG